MTPENNTPDLAALREVAIHHGSVSVRANAVNTIMDELDRLRDQLEGEIAGYENILRGERLRREAAEARLSLTEQVVQAARAAVKAEMEGRAAADSDDYTPDHVLQQFADAMEAAVDALATTLEALDTQPSEKEETP